MDRALVDPLENRNGVGRAPHQSRHVERAAGQEELVTVDLLAVLAEGLEVPQLANV